MVKFTMYNNYSFIGYVQYKINNPDSLLCRMNVNSMHRNQGYGTHMLQLSERSLRESFGVRRIQLTAWQPTGSYDIVDFYKKNGFVSSTDMSYTYDDYIQLYDLYPMTKSISGEIQ
jgi:GNAT superfamily N-acetyltransferase